MEAISFKDISVVVQGPVEATSDRPQASGLTQQCLTSIRQHLPGAKIILSTWEGSNIDRLDFDECVLSKDPGGVVYEYYNERQYYNVNRQIVSTLEGLKRVKTLYAMKLRSDNFLTSTHFLDLFNQYQQRSEELKLLKKRVVGTTWFARDPYSIFHFPFHPSDLFFFGLTEDLLAIWSVPPSDDENNYYFKHHPDPYNFLGCSLYRFTPEQYIWINFLRKYTTIECQDYGDISNNNIELSELSIANNLLLAPPKVVGFRSPKHENVNPIWHNTIYTFGQWQMLYQQYCDLNFKIPYLFLQKAKVKYQRMQSKNIGVLFYLKQNIKKHVPIIWRGYRALRDVYRKVRKVS